MKPHIILDRTFHGGQLCMRLVSFSWFRVFTLLMACATAAAGQTPRSPSDARPTVRAYRLEADETISLDGRLDEPIWKRAEPAADFRQSDPVNGAPATERTEIRIVFDREHLYIGAELYDSDPKGLIGYQLLRDG